MENGPTQLSDRSGSAWSAKPGLARLLKVVFVLAPVTASGLIALSIGRAYPPDTLRVPTILWFLGVAAVSTIVLLLTERVIRRFAPLPVLLSLSLVFPDEAPNRYAMALRTGSSRNLAKRIEEVRASGVAFDSEMSYAGQMLELLAMLSAHDRLTRGHCERVRAYTDLIIAEMGLGEKDANQLRWAALLHDLGKLMVPAKILNSSSRPDQDEWEVLKSHTWQGERLVAPLAPWLGEWVAAVGQHHERWDGGGYPAGLAGTDIHLGARIVAVADAYDVMTSARSYKKPMTSAIALEEVARCAGSQFDPDVVRAFLAVGVSRLRFVAGPLSWLASLFGLPSVTAVSAPVMASVAGTAGVAIVGAVSLVAPLAVPFSEPAALAFVDQESETADSTEFSTTNESEPGGDASDGDGSTGATIGEDSPTTVGSSTSTSVDTSLESTETTTNGPTKASTTVATTRTSTSSTPRTTAAPGTTTAPATTTTVASTGGAGLLISEFSAAGANPSGDFVELYNASGSAVSLAGVSVRLLSSGGQFESVPLGSGTLPAGSFFLLARAGSSLAGGADRTFSSSLPLSIAIGIDGGSGYIDVVGTRARTEKKPSIVAASSIAEGTGVPPFDPGSTSNPQSYVRRNATSGGSCVDSGNNSSDFVRKFHAAGVTPTASTAGSFGCGSVGSTPGVPNHLVISEIRTDGPGSGSNEFSELFNPTASPAPLAGMRLINDEGEVQFIFSTQVLAPGQHFLLAHPNFDGPAPDATYLGGGIKNGGGVTLEYIAGGVVDRIAFGSSSPELPPLGGRLHHSYTRRFGGCIDTGDYYVDFEHALTQSPQTSASAAQSC